MSEKNAVSRILFSYNHHYHPFLVSAIPREAPRIQGFVTLRFWETFLEPLNIFSFDGRERNDKYVYVLHYQVYYNGNGVNNLVDHDCIVLSGKENISAESAIKQAQQKAADLFFDGDLEKLMATQITERMNG